MPIYINNPEADQLAREVAAATGETLTEAVVTALRERRERLQAPTRDQRRKQIRALADRSRALLGGRTPSTDDLYGPDGLPT